MKKKRLLSLAVIIFAIVFSSCTIQTKEQYYNSSLEAGTITVEMSINCSTVLSNMDLLDESLKSEQYIPKNGEILKATTYHMKENDTAFDLLVRATKENKIQMEYEGANANYLSTVYIQGINNLYEFSCGELSGWMLKINGNSSPKGCNEIVLKNGDVIEWLYTCDLGKDINCVVAQGVER